MRRAALWTLCVAMMVLASGCNPSGCSCFDSPTASSETGAAATTAAPKRKMKVVQLRPDFVDERPRPVGDLVPIDPNAAPPRKPAEPSTTPASTAD